MTMMQELDWMAIEAEAHELAYVHACELVGPNAYEFYHVSEDLETMYYEKLVAQKIQEKLQ